MAKDFKEQKLLGQYFHTFGYDETTKQVEIKYQGCIEGKVTDEIYICQLFSFLDGSETNSRVVHINDMKYWKFYKTSKDMIAAFDKSNYINRVKEAA